MSNVRVERTFKQIVILLFTLSFVLLSHTNAHAATYEPVIFNTTYTTGSTITTLLGDYSLTVGVANVTSIMLSSENETIIISQGSCKRFEYQFLCNEEKIDDQTARVSLTDRRAHISTSISTSSETADFGEELQGTLWMNNTGLRSAANVLVLLPLENITINYYEDCKLNNSHLYWTGNLHEGDKESCKFTFTPEQGPTLTLSVQATYNSLTDRTDNSSSNTTITVNEPILVNITTSTDLLQLEPHQPYTVRATINNTNTKNLSIHRLEFIYDDDTLLVSKSTSKLYESRNSVWMRIATIEPEESNTVSVELSPTLINTSGEVRIQLTYSLDGENANNTLTRLFTYQTHPQEIIITTHPANLSFESLEQATINVSVYNPYNHLTFKGYNTQIRSELLSQEILTFIPYSRSRILAHINFTAPETTNKQTKEMLITVIAQTDYSQTVIARKEVKVTIQPLQGILIDHQAQETSEGRKSVTVYATNKHNRVVTATFTETFPEQLFFNGNTSTTKTLDPQARTHLYTYTALPTESGTYVLTTSMTYTYSNQPIALQHNHTLMFNTSERQIPSVQQNASEHNTTISPLDNSTGEQLTEQTREPPSSTIIPPLYLFIIIIAVLLVVIGVVVRIAWIKHHKKRAQQIKDEKKSAPEPIQGAQQHYEQLIAQRKHIEQETHVLDEQEHQTHAKIATLKEHLETYEHNLPIELKKLDAQRTHITNLKVSTHDKKTQLDQQISDLKTKEEALEQHQKKLQTILEQLKAKESALHKDEETITQDIVQLEKELPLLKQQKERKVKEHAQLLKTIKDYKQAHATKIKQRLEQISKERSETQLQDKQLTEQAEQLQQEMEQAEKDMALLEKDFAEAEKVYKQASLTRITP